jgi:uncharacterized protein
MKRSNPYNSPNEQLFSNYHALQQDTVSTPFPTQSPVANKSAEIGSLLHAFILENEHPCIMARATARRGSCRFGVYPALGSEEATAGLSRDLIHFLEERITLDDPYASFMAVFTGPIDMEELAFEKRLWKQLAALKETSDRHYASDPETSDNPEDANFGFSFGGKAFYVVGMHANSSRKARSFAYPMLVFNLHEQFEAMREQGTYEKVKTVVRQNDLELQGSINPMLQDFGQGSEARQYSGRAVSASWKCPYAH